MNVLLASLRFTSSIPVIAVILAALLVMIAVMLFYYRETRPLRSPLCYALPLLRGLAIGLAILIFSGPVWHSRRVIGKLGRVIFAVDVSSSMAITDNQSSNPLDTRLRRATKLLTGSDGELGLIDRLRSTHQVDVIAVDGTNAVEVWSSESDESLSAVVDLVADANRTNLTLAFRGYNHLATEADDFPDQQAIHTAVVLLSDGRHNRGGSPVQAAADLAEGPIQVITVGIGSVLEPVDVAVLRVLRPDSVAADGKFKGQIVIKHFGVAGEEVEVRIEQSGTTVWQKRVTVTGDGEQEIDFELDVSALIQSRDLTSDSERQVNRDVMAINLRAVIDMVERAATSVEVPRGFADNLLKENDSLPFRVAASTRARRLLILDGSSRWETRYLRNVFERDPAWEVDTIVFGSGSDSPQLERGEAAGQFPSTGEAISVYDLIVLGEVPADQMTSEDAELMRRFVSRGGGLIIIDGKYGQIAELAASGFGDLIPVDYPLGSIAGVAGPIVPTSLGVSHPVMDLGKQQAELSLFWKRLPPPSHSVAVVAKPGSEILANLRLSDELLIPWMVTRLYGSGRVFYLSSDQTWRWRYKLADKLHARFWNQLLANAMQPPYSVNNPFVAIGTDKVEYNEGDSVMIRARLKNPAGEAVGDATVDALLVVDEQVVETVPLAVDNRARGTYRGQSTPLKNGRYEVRIRASGFGSEALQASTPIWVAANDQVEWDRLSLDSNRMLEIATAGNGSYFAESEAERLLDQLKPLSSGTVVETEILLWQSFYWFWLIVLLLSIEWVLRKRAGLV